MQRGEFQFKVHISNFVEEKQIETNCRLKVSGQFRALAAKVNFILCEIQFSKVNRADETTRRSSIYTNLQNETFLYLPESHVNVTVEVFG